MSTRIRGATPASGLRVYGRVLRASRRASFTARASASSTMRRRSRSVTRRPRNWIDAGLLASATGSAAWGTSRTSAPGVATTSAVAGSPVSRLISPNMSRAASVATWCSSPVPSSGTITAQVPSTITPSSCTGVP